MEKVNLKELEKKAYKSTFQDGLWDILFGGYLLGLAIGALAPLYPESFQDLFIPIWISTIWNIGILLLFIFGKKRITVPRMGFVKFGEKRKADRKKLAIINLIMVVITIVVVILTAIGAFQLQIEGYMVMLLIGMFFIAVPFSAVAFFLKFKRLYVIAIMGGLGFFFGELLSPFIGFFGDFIVFTAFGGIIIVAGLILFIKFLKKYPLPKEEMA